MLTTKQPRKLIARPIELTGIQVVVYCPICNKKHYHGAYMDSYSGYRSPHCSSEISNNKDYYIPVNKKLIRKYYLRRTKKVMSKIL